MVSRAFGDQFLTGAESCFEIRADYELGIGGWGKVWGLEGDDDRVLKITSDRREVSAIRNIINLRKQGHPLPAFPIYYGIKEFVGCAAVPREKALCPCHVPWEKTEGFQLVAFGGRDFMAKRRYVCKHFPYITNSLRFLRKRGIHLGDIRSANIGHTLKDNQYRQAGELVLIDFH